MVKTVNISYMNDISTTLSLFLDSYSPSLSGNLRENRLERMNLLLKRIGNPEKVLKIIHIAGSKGKGTTASYMSWIMNKYNMKTGLYLSPHVFDIRERFTLGTVFFPQSLYESTLKELQKKIEGFSFPSELGPDKPTTFELYTAYGYLLFKNAGCKYAVVETGLGGRLDATNTVTPIAACFTYIEKEHTKILGSTLEEIALEKAGIMRKDVPSFFSDMPQEALATLIKEAERIGSPYTAFKLKIDELSYKGGEPVYSANTVINNSVIALENPRGFTDIELYDLNYALFVLDKLDLLKNVDTDHLNLQDGFSLPGRFSTKTITLEDKRMNFVLDGAHTPSSITHLLDNIEAYNFDSLSTLVFSTAIDKNYKEMADIIVPKFDRVIVLGLGESKKSDPKAIYDYISTKWKDKKVTLSNDSDEAINEVIETTPNEGHVVVTGSFYLVDSIFKSVKNYSNEHYKLERT